MRRCAEQWADVRAEQENFAIAADDIRFFQLHPAVAYGFDFPSFQHDAGFVAFFDEIVVEGFSVFCNCHVGMGKE